MNKPKEPRQPEAADQNSNISEKEQRRTVQNTLTDLEVSYMLAEVAAGAAAEVKAEDIVAIDVHERLALTDVFVLASASSERQVDAIVNEVDRAMHGKGLSAKAKEGKENAHWVLLDYGPIVVHVFHKEDREFYDIERLWKDCPKLDLDLEDNYSHVEKLEELAKASQAE